MSALLLAEFGNSARFIEAARGLRAAGYHLVDAFSPFPVEGLADLLEARRSHIRFAMFIGGMAMALVAYGIEYFAAVIDYPYNSGGRPFDAWPTFMLVPFATGMLVASIAGFIAFLIECGLPHLYNPLFAVEGLERASQDRFILALVRPDNADEVRKTIALLRGVGATAIREFAAESTP